MLELWLLTVKSCLDWVAMTRYAFFPRIKLPFSHALLIQFLNLNYHCFLFGEANHTGAIVNANVLVTY